KGQTTQTDGCRGSAISGRGRSEVKVRGIRALKHSSTRVLEFLNPLPYSLPLPLASARASQPHSIPTPPIGVIAPNHLKLVNAMAYSDPLKIATPIRIKKYANRGIGRHPLRTRSRTACNR